MKPEEHEVDARGDVDRFLHLLGEYGLSLEDLAGNSPRSWQERQRAKRIARMLGGDPEWMNYAKTNRRPPPELILATDSADRMLLEHNFQYITALSCIFAAPLPVLTGYIEGVGTYTMLGVKGIVLQQEGRRVTVLTEDGEFRNYRSRKGTEQGREVTVRDYGEIAAYAIAVLLLFALAVSVFYILMVSS